MTWPFRVDYDGTNVEEIDGAVYVDFLSCLIEAKDHGEPVDFEPIAKLRGRLARRPSLAIGVVFSRTGFTRPARIMSRFLVSQPILLWDGGEFSRALSASRMCEGLRAKFRYAVEYVFPTSDCLEGRAWRAT